jgi:hypothetical protein
MNSNNSNSSRKPLNSKHGSSLSTINNKVVNIGLCYCLEDNYLLEDQTRLNDTWIDSESTEFAKFKKPKGFWGTVISFFDDTFCS